MSVVRIRDVMSVAAHPDVATRAAVLQAPLDRELANSRAQASPPKISMPEAQTVEEEVDVPFPDPVSNRTVRVATSATHTSESRASIEQAFTEIRLGAVKAAEWHSRRAVIYGRLYFALGIPAVVLASLAAAAGLASAAGRVPAAIIALVAAAIGAVNTFLDGGGQRRYHQQMAAQWFHNAAEAKLHLLTDIHEPEWVSGEGREAVRRLLSRQAQLLEGRSGMLVDSKQTPS